MTQKDKRFVDDDIESNLDVFRSALSATADGVVITDNQGNIRWVNPAYEKLTGYSITEVKNNNPRILKSGKQNPAFYKELWDTILAGKVWSGELWNKRKDGVIYLEEQSITPVISGNGVITHFIAIKRDVTEQHQLREQLHLVKRIEAIGQLTAGVAHNFNNKLASILGFTELASEEAKQYLNEEVDDCLSEIMVAAKSSRDLVRQMMAFSLNEVSELKQGNVDLIVREAIKLISSTIPSTIKVKVDLKEVPQSMFDPVRLHQMLISLAMNATKAMPRHGELTLSTELIQIENIECSSCHENINGEFVSISIKDTGKGILPENMEEIFMPFFTTYQNEGGTGMGLSALHGMLHEMHGHVIVESEPNQYTTFTLLLPVDKYDNESIISHRSEDAMRAYKDVKHIMIVDDEESFANFLSEILELNGYQVTKEINSKEALKNISKFPDKYDLLITDQGMPELSGVELAKMVNDIRQDLPIILITGYKVDKDNKEFKFVNEILNKPFETKELLSKIKNI